MDKKNRNILIGLALLLGLFFFMRARRKTNEVDATMNAVTGGNENNTTTVNEPVQSNLIVCYSGCPNSQASTHDVGISGNSCEDLGLLPVPPACANPNDSDPCPQGMATARSTNARGMQQNVCVGSPITDIPDFDPDLDDTPSTIIDQFPTISNFAEAVICPKLCTYWGAYELNPTSWPNLQGFLNDVNYFIEIAESEYGVTYTPEQAINFLKQDCRKYVNTSLSDPYYYGCSFALQTNEQLADALLIQWNSYGAGDQITVPSINAYETNYIVSNLGGTGVGVDTAQSTSDLTVAEADLGGGFGTTNLGSGATTTTTVLDTLGTSVPTALQTNLSTR